ncbi:hypothetical protein C8Q79DRAFT_126548 [Trametes meyenii]|nr:hypothetical protein C8Q79DRAFT_126548 [Trametes meyenii]
MTTHRERPAKSFSNGRHIDGQVEGGPNAQWDSKDPHGIASEQAALEERHLHRNASYCIPLPTASLQSG